MKKSNGRRKGNGRREVVEEGTRERWKECREEGWLEKKRREGEKRKRERERL